MFACRMTHSSLRLYGRCVKVCWLTCWMVLCERMDPYHLHSKVREWLTVIFERSKKDACRRTHSLHGRGH